VLSIRLPHRTHRPQLTCNNYEYWSLMKVRMEARGLWDMVEHGDPSRQDDCIALNAIMSTVPPEMIRTLALKETPKGAWVPICSMFVSSNRTYKSTL
jgi:hypothetical protein